MAADYSRKESWRPLPPGGRARRRVDLQRESNEELDRLLAQAAAYNIASYEVHTLTEMATPTVIGESRPEKRPTAGAPAFPGPEVQVAGGQVTDAYSSLTTWRGIETSLVGPGPAMPGFSRCGGLARACW